MTFRTKFAQIMAEFAQLCPSGKLANCADLKDTAGTLCPCSGWILLMLKSSKKEREKNAYRVEQRGQIRLCTLQNSTDQ